jgi:DNA mismatch endonuclease (patch repair protein)
MSLPLRNLKDKSTFGPKPPVPRASSPAVRALMVGNRGKDTIPEQRVRSLLHRAGFRFRKHSSPLPGLRCEADIVFPREKVAVFIDGCFWHGCPEHGHIPKRNSSYWADKIARNVARDKRNTAALAEAGWLALRFWEHQEPSDVVADIRTRLLGVRQDRYHNANERC